MAAEGEEKLHERNAFSDRVVQAREHEMETHKWSIAIYLNHGNLHWP